MHGCKCLIVADDLTGACDASVGFARHGHPTAVVLSGEAGDAAVIAVSTESRDAEEATIAARMTEAAQRWPSRQVFKKIDSTLRGNTRAEIREAMRAFGCDSAMVTPAFPALGRVVCDGRLRLPADPDFVPIDVAQQIGLGQVMDAATDAELDHIVERWRGMVGRVLLAGSGGLAAALARSVAPTVSMPRPDFTRGPVLFCLGSTHKVTVAQEEELAPLCGGVHLDAGRVGPGEVSGILASGSSVILRIPRGEVPVERTRELIAVAPAAALLVTGGDTASHVCAALGTRRIDLVEEIVPGIPWGIARGGAWDGQPVATKSGGFGPPDALCRVAVFFGKITR